MRNCNDRIGFPRRATGANRVPLASGIAGLLVLAALQGCATNPVTGKQDFVLMSEQQEISLGRQYHGEIMKQYVAYDDPALQAYVDRIGQELEEIGRFLVRSDLVHNQSEWRLRLLPHRCRRRFGSVR